MTDTYIVFTDDDFLSSNVTDHDNEDYSRVEESLPENILIELCKENSVSIDLTS